MIRRAPWLLVPLLLVTACTATDAGGAGAASPFADCATLTAPPAAISPAAAATAPNARAGAGTPLPAIELSCFTGGGTVGLGAIRGPAVVNLWASWCDPCRKELPAFQRLAERASGRVHVIGVNTKDTRSGAQSLGEDFQLTFPMLFDPREQLRSALQRNVLPMTLFVDHQGRIRHVADSKVLDDAALSTLVARHLGVAVAA